MRPEAQQQIGRPWEAAREQRSALLRQCDRPPCPTTPAPSEEGGLMTDSSPTTRLQQLIHRTDRVLAVMHAPTAAHARLMELAGAEVAFVGTSGVVGTYTGLADVGVATMTECLTIAGWIAQSVRFPVIIDGDTGHGGIMAVRRLVRECIEAGLAGLRLDDQPLEQKRRTMSAS